VRDCLKEEKILNPSLFPPSPPLQVEEDSTVSGTPHQPVILLFEVIANSMLAPRTRTPPALSSPPKTYSVTIVDHRV